MVMPLLPACIMGMSSVSDWGTFPLPSIKQKIYKPVLQAILFDHGNWRPLRLPEFTHCRIEA